MTTATRDPSTAALIVLLLGALAELEAGESVATKYSNDNDNEDGRWRVSFELAAADGASSSPSPSPSPSIERIEVSTKRGPCPLCGVPALDVESGRCTNCPYPD